MVKKNSIKMCKHKENPSFSVTFTTTRLGFSTYTFEREKKTPFPHPIQIVNIA